MTTKRPLSYLGVDSPNPPRVVTAARAPLATDYNGYVLGDIWINTAASTSYILTSKAGGTSTWGITTPGSSDVDTINSLTPVAGNIVISGGTNITDINAGNTVTLNLDNAITLATSVSSPIYTSAGAIDINVAAGQNVTIQLGDAAGAQVLEIEDSASAAVATIDSNGIATFAGIDGVLGGVTPADVTGKTITANTKFVSGTYTAPAATDIAITAITGKDIDIKMGDNAGANNVSFLDSDGVAVFSIDSNGSIGTLAGLTVAGAFAQTAGTFNVGQDNAANAINIGGGNVARAITIASTGAHTLNIGSAAAGAIAIDTAAGISLDGATASNFTVTGAAQDLTLSSVGGSVNVSGSEAAVNAVRIHASDAAGGIDVDSGTNGMTLDTTGAISLDAAAASNFSVAGAGIDLTLASAAGRVVVNGEEAAADAITLLSAAGGLDTNVALQINLDSSQAAATAVRIVASDAAGGIDIDAGTAGIAVDTTGAFSIDGAAASNVTVTGAFDLTLSSTAGSSILTSGEAAADALYLNASDAAGGITLASGTGGVIGDTTGNIELNSSAGTILIGNDDVDQNASFATDGERVVTIGSTNGAASLVLQSGTGEITVTGTVKQLDAEFITRSGVDLTFSSSPIVQSNANTGAAPTGATGDVNLLMFQEGFVLREFVKGAEQTIIAPRADATGLLVSGDLTATEGYEINADASRANAPLSFTIGTSPAFFAEISFTVADVSGCEPMYFGFRKTQADAADYTTYTDFVGYGLNNLVAAGDCVIATNLNNAGVNTTDTNDAWADTATHTLQVLVSSAGVVTFTFDGGAPTATQAFTFDNGDVVHFWYTHVFGAGAPGTIHWNSLKVGYQA